MHLIKSQALQKYIQTGKLTDRAIYLSYLNVLKKLIKIAEKKHYAHKFHSINGILHKTLISKTNYNDSISSLKVNDILSTDPLVITNTLNDFFVNVGDVLPRELNRSQLPSKIISSSTTLTLSH